MFEQAWDGWYPQVVKAQGGRWSQDQSTGC